MSAGVDALLRARTEIDAELRKHKSPVTVMFTDLAGSTAFFERFGDTAGVVWLEQHNQIVLPQVEAHGGVLVKTIGDSVMAYFTDPQRGVIAAAAIQQGLHVANRDRDAKEQMYVRVGLHQGLGYLRGGDIFGDVVNVAARIVKACLPAQILASESVFLSACEASNLQFRPVGAMQFHGKTTKENIYEVLWADEATYAELRRQFPAVPQAPLEGVTPGRYQILSELGRGAMGVVYKAYDRTIGRVVALKTIPLEVGEPERADLVGRLKQEARAAGILDHPNIITVHDVGEEGGLFYLTMQYVEGQTLEDLHAQRALLPVEQVLDIADQICRALAFAHERGVVHRDLKPSNLILSKQGIIKVLDFGIAKMGDAGLTRVGVILGTPSYLAPEQAAGRRIDQRADIFALGAVLYELLTGEKAFPGESTTTIVYKILNEDPVPPRAIEPSLSPALDAIVRKALAKDPLQRFQSCEEMRQALLELRQPKPATETPPKPAAEPALRPPTILHAPAEVRRFGRWLAAALVLIIVVATIIHFRARSSAPAGMVAVPATTFSMGRNGGNPDEGPSHPVSVSAFYIDQTEVTHAAYSDYLRATGHPAPSDWQGARPLPGTENLPVSRVSWHDARSFCEWAGKRLPTEAEWELAARGSDGRLFPWGQDFAPGRAVTLESGAQGPQPAGSYRAGASPFGVLDLAGNVWEWCADDYKPYPGSSARPLPPGSQARVIRGGSFGSDAAHATATTRSYELVDQVSESVGFRCARSH